MPALNPAADDDADVDKVSCESFCDLWAVADIDTPDACQSGQTAGAAGPAHLRKAGSYVIFMGRMIA